MHGNIVDRVWHHRLRRLQDADAVFTLLTVRNHHGRCVRKAMLVGTAEDRDVFGRQSVQSGLQRINASDACDVTAGPPVLKKTLHGDGKSFACTAAHGAFEIRNTRDCHCSVGLLRNPDEPHGAGGDTLDGMMLRRQFFDINTRCKIFRHRKGPAWGTSRRGLWAVGQSSTWDRLGSP
jgi:hypothetical protein